MGKQNADRFIRFVRASRLLSDDQLNLALQELQQEAGGVPPTSAYQVATHLVDKGLLTQWQSNRLREGRHKGFYLDKYKLLSHIDVGDTSGVYLAEHLLLLCHRAIKVLPKKRAEDTSHLHRFYREARAAAALHHPNIVRVHDMGNDGCIHFLVMEYVDGDDLESMVKQKGPLDYPLAVDYIRQAARGLSHVHKHGLTHGDVKPAHLLVNRENVVKVLDIGVAKFSNQDTPEMTGDVSPEQLIAPCEVDAAADIHGLGCCLYYLLTGSSPFTKSSLPQWIVRLQAHTPPDIRKSRPDAPDDLVKICAKMMAKKPEERFQKMSDVVAILTRWLVTHGQ